MKRIIPLFLAALLGAACYSDNAAPETHGAHNKPSEVAGGDTTVDKAPATATGQTTTGANDLTGSDSSTTYGQSGGQPGGAQTTPKK